VVKTLGKGSFGVVY